MKLDNTNVIQDISLSEMYLLSNNEPNNPLIPQKKRAAPPGCSP